MKDCIYCRQPTRNEPEEHIFPEGLVGDRPIKVRCPNGKMIKRRIVLNNDEVCKKCNKALGRLDQHLQEQLGFFKVLINKGKTKKGRSPRVEKPGMVARRLDKEIDVILNLSNGAIKAHDGIIVGPAKEKESAVRVTRFNRNAENWSGSFTQEMRVDKKFVRSLYKIGFELLCLWKGRRYVCNKRFDSLRLFIRKGIGDRQALMGTGVSNDLIPGFKLTYDNKNKNWVAALNLGLQFLLDLSPANIIFPRLTDSSL